MLEDFFHPRAGYQINTLAPALVKRGYRVTIVTSELEKIPRNLREFFGTDNISVLDEEFYKATGVRIIRVPIITYYSGRSIYKSSIVKFIRSLKPDLFFLHGMDTYAGILFTLKSSKLGFPMVVDCHMAEIASQNKFSKIFRRFYKTFVTPRLTKNAIPVIDVTLDGYPERVYGVPSELVTKIPLMNVDTGVFRPDEKLRREFREMHQIPLKAVVIAYAGKIDELKGGMILAKALSEPLLTEKAEVYVVIASSNNDNYAKHVKEVIASSGNKTIIIPTVPFRELPKLYNGTDLFVIPKQSSMSFFHAQACGVPVVLEDNQINRTRASGAGVFFFKSGDPNDLRKRILEFLNLEETEIRALKEKSRDFIFQNYDFEKILDSYERVFEKALNNFWKSGDSR